LKSHLQRKSKLYKSKSVAFQKKSTFLHDERSKPADRLRKLLMQLTQKKEN
jgi:hypothetical protein